MWFNYVYPFKFKPQTVPLSPTKTQQAKIVGYKCMLSLCPENGALIYIQS
jgi:hypothetical protein